MDSNGILPKGTVKDNGLKFCFPIFGIKTDGQVTAQDGYIFDCHRSQLCDLFSFYSVPRPTLLKILKTNYRKDIDLEKYC